MSRSKAKGKVYLVGAGPGDPDLITVKAVKLLQSADVIIHDHLVNSQILQHALPGTEIIFAGKFPSRHLLDQDSINQLLVTKAQQKKIVIRLKGGDPLLFGRGAEEALALIQAGIPFEIVPGVTSALSVPAYAGIPLTFRNIASRLTIVTGHQATSQNTPVIPWATLIDQHSTLVILMGLANLEKILKRLGETKTILAMPVAVISHGTLPDQKVVIGTVSTISTKVRKARLTQPAVIVIGKVALMHKKLTWFSTKFKPGAKEKNP